MRQKHHANKLKGERTGTAAIEQGIWQFLSANSLFQSDVKCPTATFLYKVP